MPETSLSYLAAEWSYYREEIADADSPVFAAAYYVPLLLLTILWWLLTRPLAMLAWPVRRVT